MSISREYLRCVVQRGFNSCFQRSRCWTVLVSAERFLLEKRGVSVAVSGRKLHGGAEAFTAEMRIHLITHTMNGENAGVGKIQDVFASLKILGKQQHGSTIATMSNNS